MRGRFVVFEGIDGCGKSSQLARLAQAMRAEGADPLVTAEPTQGAYGRRIRAMARSGERVAPDEELRWFVEDRREHVMGEIEPALAAGRLVLCDRYYLSTVAYQGARGRDWRALLAASEAEFPQPDLALLFELGVDAALARLAGRRGVASEPVFEQRDYLLRVAEIFAALDLPYLRRIDASPSETQIAPRVRALVAELGI